MGLNSLIYSQFFTLTIQYIMENSYLNSLILCKNIMQSYCVKQRKQTACVPGSGTPFLTKNYRNVMKCICAECEKQRLDFLKVLV